MTPSAANISWAGTFTPAERRVLFALRARYLANPDVWTDRELAHLRFLRWLYQTGRFGKLDQR